MYINIKFKARRIVLGMDANFKLINNALKCNPLKPFVQIIKFSNLNERIQLLECFSPEFTSGKHFLYFF